MNIRGRRPGGGRGLWVRGSWGTTLCIGITTAAGHAGHHSRLVQFYTENLIYNLNKYNAYLLLYVLQPLKAAHPAIRQSTCETCFRSTTTETATVTVTVTISTVTVTTVQS